MDSRWMKLYTNNVASLRGCLDDDMRMELNMFISEVAHMLADLQEKVEKLEGDNG